MLNVNIKINTVGRHIICSDSVLYRTDHVDTPQLHDTQSRPLGILIPDVIQFWENTCTVIVSKDTGKYLGSAFETSYIRLTVSPISITSLLRKLVDVSNASQVQQ